MKNETKIAPRIVDGEPVCSGEACPAWRSAGHRCTAITDLGHLAASVIEGDPCLPGLRRLLATRTEERDTVRRLYCAYRGAAQGDSKRFAPIVADELGWQHLYAPAPPATGTEEGGVG